MRALAARRARWPARAGACAALLLVAHAAAVCARDGRSAARGSPAPVSLRIEVAGGSIEVAGFRLDDESAGTSWLSSGSGLELEVSSGPTPDGSTAEEIEAGWLESFVEEDGFRRLRAVQRDLRGVRLSERVYGVADRLDPGARRWRTFAALLVSDAGHTEITLLAPPGARDAGERAFRRILSSHRRGGRSGAGQEPAGR